MLKSRQHQNSFRNAMLAALLLVFMFGIVRCANAADWHSSRVSTYGGPGEYQETHMGTTHRLEHRHIMYVAHKTLPFGTIVRFKYHGHEVNAIVADRGPYVSGRTFDLGHTTAAKLHFNGVGSVKYQVLGKLSRKHWYSPWWVRHYRSRSK